ncbi:uncharacterized protein LOC106181429 [Lingula anatina]|uniref:Uncharacterized protein LOC106181429 n=1 Tax=Lingula anatina TaxID=7574 RepID=A0A1S3KF40_LINAN|nr:uncharacterized protein LOC106181429 [Lingula anatina]|eukprot:XP_013421255.1 uncharacterized protein LOC106181429 [Lingula anatina]
MISNNVIDELFLIGLPPNTTVGGAVYTRWGRTKCGASSKLLYEGYTAGSWYEHKGGASNYICLPHDPQWGNYQDGFQNSGTKIYGTEYEMGHYSNDPFQRINFGGKNFKDHDAPCAVCYTQGRTSHVMIPAWKTCPAGWTREYHGYLVAQQNSQYRTEFVCLDEAPEVVAGGVANKNGALFYVSEAYCGHSLPCPKYVHGRELTCVVCSK